MFSYILKPSHLKVNDRVCVVRYFTHQDDLDFIEGKVTAVSPGKVAFGANYEISFRHSKFKHKFSRHSSPGVFSSKLIASYQEYFSYLIKTQWRMFRLWLSEKIAP